MAALSIVGKTSDSKQQFTRTFLAGTETISATVGAGQIALIVDSGVPSRSLNVDVLAKRLADALREAGYAA